MSAGRLTDGGSGERAPRFSLKLWRAPPTPAPAPAATPTLAQPEDECPDDSDEDVITDYLSEDQPSVESNSGAPMAVNKHEVPTISVTPHSPGTKVYPVLEDNLQHLHEIHENVQQMRDLNTQAIHAIHAQILGLTQYSRLSASCPSLNNEGASDLDVEASLNSSPTQPTPLGSSVNPCFPETLQTKAPKDWLMCRDGSGDVPRRRSWTALEDLTGGRAKRKSERQRSMSLSSLDSEPDDPFLDRVDGAGSTGLLLSETASLGGGGTGSAGSGGRRSARGSGGASTHSLNEADLQNDFNKLAAKREMDNLRLLPIRLPLQKSVSTPSILAVRDMVGEAVTDSTPAIPAGTESETEEELMPSGKHLVTPHINIALDEFLTDAAYDHRSGKRRKRGSIFFRKKKDKTKKVPHQWVSACYGSAHACDWCSKPVTNKPALYCENCMTTVHQNSCKDQIQDCSKPKISKNSGKGTAFPAVMSTSKLSGNKRGSSSTQSQNHHSSSSSSQIINEEREGDYGQHDGLGYYDDVPLVQFEFLDEGPITASDLETDPFLGLQDDEPDSWTPTVGKEVAKKLKEKEVKRQEHIYEFILTEKHHCLTLRVMQKVFVEGFQKHFQLGNDLERMFPCLSELTEIHLNFLQRLRQRQKEEPVVVTISDILLEQFSGVCAEKLKSAYGEFCSRHRDAVNIYKNYLHDRRFAEFVKHCQVNPLLKKKGIPECILFVTQRLTKYPLLIEPLIKTAKDNKVEQENLTKALALVKEILVEVDAQVAEKEKEDRKLEIYNKIEAKSFTIYRGNKFKKSDILLENRKLRFEGVSTLMQGRSKMQVVLVIVLSDVLFFLLENNNKYSFFTPDNKAGVVSLQKLLVREKAGQDSRGIYLISSNPSEPEMFELKVHKPKDKQVWIRAIRSAVENCQEDEDEGIVLSLEEKQKLMEAKQLQIRQIVGMLRQKDLEQAQILEEKMALQQKLLAAAGVENILNPPNYTSLMSEDTDSSVIWQEVKSAVHEVNQLANSLCASGTNLSRSVSSVGEHQSEAYISPTLPKRAETFGGFDNANKEQLPMAITKGVVRKLQQRESRDHSNYSTPVMTPDSESSPSSKQETVSPKVSHDQPPWRSAVMATIPPVVLPSNVCENSCEVPALSSLAQDQQTVAVQLSHYFYKLLSIIHHQMTTINSLQAQLSACKVQLTQDDAKDRRPVYKHNQQLEELRNLQDRLTQEKEAWQREKEAEEKELDEKKQELLRLQEQVRAESEDVRQQREKLYSKLEYLTSQGILISPNMPVVTAVPPEDSLSGQGILIRTQPEDMSVTGVSGDCSPPVPDSRRKADSHTSKRKPGSNASSSCSSSATTNKATLPLNLISATNQQKVQAQSVQVKQQLPYKLATKLGGSSSGTGNSSSSSSSSSSVVQQILPYKLSQGQSPTSSATESTSGRRGSGYRRLGSGSFSPPSRTAAADETAAPSPHSHVRTGSSPASMQSELPSPPPVESGMSRRSAGGLDRTHNHPVNRVGSPGPESAPQPASSRRSADEEVIYF